MGKLRYFNKSEYNGLGDLLAAVKKELEALQPQDSADIVWSKSANGISAKLKKFSAGSETGESNEDDTVQKGSTEYNGYFKLILAESESGVTLRVVDGATYKDENNLGGASTAKVNSQVFSIEPYVTMIDKSTLVVLKYTAPSSDGTAASLVIDTTLTELPSDNYINVYWQIGRVLKDADGKYSVSQDWIGGIPYMLWFSYCTTSSVQPDLEAQ